MGTIITAIIGMLSGGSGKALGDTVANIAAVATLAPVGLWLLDHKEEMAISLTWGQLALFGAFAFVIIKVVHYTRPGA